jgi:hypothetical protein
MRTFPSWRRLSRWLRLDRSKVNRVATATILIEGADNRNGPKIRLIGSTADGDDKVRPELNATVADNDYKEAKDKQINVVSTKQYFGININDDPKWEEDEKFTFSVAVDNDNTSDEANAQIVNGTATITILNDGPKPK